MGLRFRNLGIRLVSSVPVIWDVMTFIWRHCLLLWPKHKSPLIAASTFIHQSSRADLKISCRNMKRPCLLPRYYLDKMYTILKKLPTRNSYHQSFWVIIIFFYLNTLNPLQSQCHVHIKNKINTFLKNWNSINRRRFTRIIMLCISANIALILIVKFLKCYLI